MLYAESWIADDGRSRYGGSDFPEQLEPFPADAIFECGEARSVSAGSSKAIDYPGTYWIRNDHEHDRQSTGQM